MEEKNEFFPQNYVLFSMRVSGIFLSSHPKERFDRTVKEICFRDTLIVDI